MGMQWERISLSDVKKGMAIREYCGRRYIEMVAEGDSELIGDMWTLKVKCENGETITLSHKIDCEHYGPKLRTEMDVEELERLSGEM